MGTPPWGLVSGRRRRPPPGQGWWRRPESNPQGGVPMPIAIGSCFRIPHARTGRQAPARPPARPHGFTGHEHEHRNEHGSPAYGHPPGTVRVRVRVRVRVIVSRGGIQRDRGRRPKHASTSSLKPRASSLKLWKHASTRLRLTSTIPPVQKGGHGTRRTSTPDPMPACRVLRGLHAATGPIIQIVVKSSLHRRRHIRCHIRRLVRRLVRHCRCRIYGRTWNPHGLEMARAPVPS
jgi:hypothetical protein